MLLSSDSFIRQLISKRQEGAIPQACLPQYLIRFFFFKWFIIEKIYF